VHYETQQPMEIRPELWLLYPQHPLDETEWSERKSGRGLPTGNKPRLSRPQPVNSTDPMQHTLIKWITDG
jgi:hypothetical protein